MKITYSKEKVAGFSIPEVILSCFVLSVGLVVVVATLSGSIRFSQVNRDIIIASELAQEGVELVRNVRDNNFTTSDGFDSFSSARKNCRIDWDDTSITCTATLGASNRYYLQYSGGAYSHASTTRERFSRYIYIDYSNSNDQALVRSFVYWGNSSTHPTDLSTGDPNNCTAANNCVFSQAFLTAWH